MVKLNFEELIKINQVKGWNEGGIGWWKRKKFQVEMLG